jgi:hypothetical protein
MNVFFTAHHHRLAAIDIPEPRLLPDPTIFSEHLRLPLNLKFHRLLHEFKGVDILQLDLGPECFLTGRSKREVRFTPQAAFFHIPVAHTKVHQQLTQRLEIGDHFLGGMQIGLGDDFQQRGPCPIEIHTAAHRRFVDIFSSVFLQMCPVNTDSLPVDPDLDVDPSLLANWGFVLGDLIPLRQIGIEIVFSGELIP